VCDHSFFRMSADIMSCPASPGVSREIQETPLLRMLLQMMQQRTDLRPETSELTGEEPVELRPHRTHHSGPFFLAPETVISTRDSRCSPCVPYLSGRNVPYWRLASYLSRRVVFCREPRPHALAPAFFPQSSRDLAVGQISYYYYASGLRHPDRPTPRSRE